MNYILKGIAKKGNYGSYLLTEKDLVCKIIKTVHDNLKIPITVKMRILPEEKDTL